MSDKFLGSGQGSINLSNGSATIYSATLGAASLDPSRPVKTNSVKQLISANLDISEVNNLQQILDNTLTNPYIGTLKATDFESDDYFSFNDELQKIDNFTASTQAPDTTNITGLVNADEVATGRVYDTTQSTFIELDGVDVNVSANDLKLNGNSVLVGASITDLETKTQNIDLTTTIGQTDISGDLWLGGTANVDTSLVIANNLNLLADVNGGYIQVNTIGQNISLTTDSHSLIVDDSNISIRPSNDNFSDLGTPSFRFKDAYLSGNANVDGTVQSSQVNVFAPSVPEILIRDTDTSDINAFLAQIAFQNSLGADASRIVYSNGTLSLENSGNGDIVFDTSNNVVPAITDTIDLGTGMLKWKDMYMSGLANIDTGVIVGNEMEMKTDAVGGFIKVSTIGQNLTLTTDNHSLVIDDSAISVRPSNDNFSSLGTSSFRFKDAYLSGNLQTNSISAASLLIVNDTFRGASIGGGTLGLEAQFIPFSYLELTQNVISPAISTGSITYQVATTGAIGTQFGVEFEIYISDNAGEDGNGVGLFWGTTTPTLLNSTTGNTTFTMFSYNAGADNGQAQYRIASNGTVQSSTLSGFVGTLPRNVWTRVKYLVNGSTLQGFTVDMNTPVYSITTTTPPTGSETVFGLLGNANGSLDTAYRVRNLQIYTGLVNPGSPNLNVSSNTTFNNDLIVYGNVNGITPVGGLFAQTVDVDFTAATSPDTQQMIGVGAGTLTIPANGFQIGDSFHLKCGGIKSNGNGNTIQIKLMSGAVILVDTGAISLPGLSVAPWELEADFTIRTLGGAGVASLNSNGQLTFTDAGVYEGFGFNSLNNTTFDTTISNTLTMDITQSNAGNLVSVTNLVLIKTF